MSGTITHRWNGTILTVTSDSGTSSADLKGAKGDTGIRGAQGPAGGAINDVSLLDKTLSIENYAADAKAVGDRLAAVDGSIAAKVNDAVSAAIGANKIVNSESGDAITLTDSSDSALERLHIYGKTEQLNEPSPTAPSELISAGMGGSITANICGKNLFTADINNPYDVTYIYTDGVTHTKKGFEISLPNGTYIAHIPSATSISNVYLYGCVRGSDGVKKQDVTILANTGIFKPTFTITDGDNLLLYHGANGVTSAQTTTLFTNYPVQIEAGTTATAYEAPKPIQALTALTPNDLRGIAIASGGNYTDGNGQQWLCDEIDFARGKYIQRVVKVAPTEVASIGIGTHSSGTKYAETSAKGVLGGNAPLSTHYKGKGWTTDNNCAYTLANKIIINDNRFTDVATANAILAEEKPEFICVLAQPIETALTTEELAAFAALHSNKPNTTIFNDAGAGMSADYVADTKLYIDKKFNELAAAIVAN